MTTESLTLGTSTFLCFDRTQMCCTGSLTVHSKKLPGALGFPTEIATTVHLLLFIAWIPTSFLNL